ncbi:MAG: Uma2 family endonuclease [Saprospiraceae bacterium]|nr:Uma2 family endonuclease [Saprospiraceae bacterium]
MSPMAIAHQQNLHITYPETDGQPMAENTLQFEWIVLIKLGLEAAFRNRDDIFVAGDLFWYPEEGQNKIRLAPDVLVAVGRPKGHRSSYLQWLEAGIAPQIVFEILSPGNTRTEMEKKFRFYEKYGVEEYYIYDPDHNEFEVYIRQSGSLMPVSRAESSRWTSPLLRVRMEWSPKTLTLFQPDGKRFLSYLELLEFGEVAEQQAEAERARTKLAQRVAKREKLRAEKEQQRAEKEQQRAEKEQQRAETAEQRAERLAEQLRKLGIDPEV